MRAVSPPFRRDEALLGPVAPECLGARAKSRAHQRALRAQHQRRRQAAAVDDAARGDHRRGRDEIDDGRHERQRGAAAAMAARLGALRDDEIGARLARKARLVDGPAPGRSACTRRTGWPLRRVADRRRTA